MSLVAWLRRFFHGRDKFAPRAPTQCHLWHIKAIGAQDIAGAFALVEGLFDDGAHNSADLVRCRDCGQLYLSVFEEHIDFSGDDDDIFRLYLPVERGDDAAGLAKLGLLRLSDHRPHLRADPGHVRWVR
jgi:hypothetical protein